MEENRRKGIAHKSFETFNDCVLIKGKRVRPGMIILPDTIKDKDENIIYDRLYVESYGDLTRYVNIGDVIKLSEFAMKAGATEIAWQESVEAEDGKEDTVDFMIVSESFIRGRWTEDALNENE